MSQNTTKGGRKRGKDKSWEYFECRCCKGQVNKRKSVFLGNDGEGKPIRICKAHKITTKSPGVKTLI